MKGKKKGRGVPPNRQRSSFLFLMPRKKRRKGGGKGNELAQIPAVYRLPQPVLRLVVASCTTIKESRGRGGEGRKKRGPIVKYECISNPPHLSLYLYLIHAW